MAQISNSSTKIRLIKGGFLGLYFFAVNMILCKNDSFSIKIKTTGWINQFSKLTQYKVYYIKMILQKRFNQSFKQAGNLFLEMKLIKLKVTGTTEGQIRISIFKGLQKLDETATFELKPNSQLIIDQSILNFHIREYEKKKNISFKIVSEFVGQTQQELGSFNIEAKNLIQLFTKDGVNTFAMAGRLTKNVQLQYMLFIQKTKSEVMRSMKNFQQSKQNDKNAGLKGQQAITNSVQSIEWSNCLNSKVFSTPFMNHHTLTQEEMMANYDSQINSSKGNNFQQASHLSNSQNPQKLKKIWYQMQDGKQKINNLVPRKKLNKIKVASVGSAMTLNLKIVGGLVILGIIVYLAILLDDMNYGMNVMRNAIENQLRSGSL